MSITEDLKQWRASGETRQGEDEQFFFESRKDVWFK